MNLILNYEGFEPYLVATNLDFFGGVQYRFEFENDYGASVIKHSGSYGHEQDLWELAVTKRMNAGKWRLWYDTPITDDVEGWLTDEEVRNLLREIKGL